MGHREQEVLVKALGFIDRSLVSSILFLQSIDLGPHLVNRHTMFHEKVSQYAQEKQHNARGVQLN